MEEKPKAEADKPYDPADEDFDEPERLKKEKEKEIEKKLIIERENDRIIRDRERDAREKDSRYGARSYRSNEFATPSSTDMGYTTAPSEFSTSFGSAGTTPLR